MALTRRFVLGSGLVGLTSGLIPGLRNLAFAAEGTPRPLLIMLHLRGGCDGLNLISPATDAGFVASRATELRVTAEGDGAGHALANGPDPTIDFRLHASANGLAEIYQSGQLAFIHGAGLTDATRSHFVATDMIDRGVADEQALMHTDSGWLSRYLSGTGRHHAGVYAASATGTLAGELRGTAGAVAIPDLAYGFGPAGGPPVAAALRRLYASGPDDVTAAGRESLQAMAEIDRRIPRDDKNKPLPYQPEGGANYDPAAEFGRSLKTLAQLIRMDLGLEAATVELGGWDTHEGQQYRFKTCVEKLSNGLTAFWNDLSAYHDRMVVVMVSEFGRRLRSNRSGGTDHGRAGVMAMLGGRVAGGRFHGPWPGLAADQLDEGVDLAVATDYRRVLQEVLEAREGHSLGPVFAKYDYPGGLGLFKRPNTAAL